MKPEISLDYYTSTMIHVRNVYVYEKPKKYFVENYSQKLVVELVGNVFFQSHFVSWRFMVRNFISSTYLCLSLICFPSWPILISFNWKQWERSQFRLKDRQNRKQRVFQLLEILVHWQVSVWDVQNIFEACATLPSTQVFKKREGVYAYQR